MLALVAAIALIDTVDLFGGDALRETRRTRLKWPNDVLLDGAKLSGILLEAVEGAVVIGFGVNLAHHPEGLDRPATSLAAAGIPAPEPATFADALADRLADWVGRWRTGGADTICRAWLARAHPPGTALRTTDPAGTAIDGLFDGLDVDGSLRLRRADGSIHLLHAGDVFLL